MRWSSARGARLNPPYIGHLLDAGRTTDGLPCIVMEAVIGRPIDVATSLLQPSRAQAVRLAGGAAGARRGDFAQTKLTLPLYLAGARRQAGVNRQAAL